VDFRSERLVQLEMGHRVRVGSTASIETTIFTGSYDDLSTSEPFEPTVELTPAPAHVLAGVALQNLLSARVGGVELNAHWNPAPRWEVEASYSRLHVTADPDAASVDTAAAKTDGSAPRHQWQARSTVSLRRGLDIGASIWRVGRLQQLAVPGYTRIDAKAEFRVNGRMTVAAIAQNLSNDHHHEFASQAIFLTSRVPRSVRFDLRWEF
jgi:outer membrane receptor protein involved in Fe transport